MRVPQTRRQFVRTAGLGVVALADCAGDGGDGGYGGGAADAVTGEDYPAIDEWLTGTDVGDATRNYDGSFEVVREQVSLTIDVGAEGNDGNFAFAPPAVVVSGGTEIQWNWTGEGNPHNVVAAPGDQIGESDYEFSSGDPEGGSGVNYTQTFEEPGIALYHCTPHLSLGTKGGIAVE